MSPFRSKKQRGYLWANEPAIAESWAKEGKHDRKQSKKSRKRRGKREGNE